VDVASLFVDCDVFFNCGVQEEGKTEIQHTDSKNTDKPQFLDPPSLSNSIQTPLADGKVWALN
jgi:hypothetical protein